MNSKVSMNSVLEFLVNILRHGNPLDDKTTNFYFRISAKHQVAEVESQGNGTGYHWQMTS